MPALLAETIPTPGADKWQPYAGAAAFFLLALTGYGGYLVRTRRPPRDVPDPDPDPALPRLFDPGTIGGTPAPRLAEETLDVLADSLGYFRSETPSRKLDVAATVVATGKNAGLPSLVFERRKQVRRVVILEDADAATLEWNPIAAELAAGLSRRGVPVVHGRFHGVPDRFRTADGELHLEDLEDELGDLVLVFSDGKGLRPGKAHQIRYRRVFDVLVHWPMVAWMEPREPRAWDAATAVPASFGVPVYPASPEGLLKALGRFLTERAPRSDLPGPGDWRGLPAQHPDVELGVHVERLLGDALLWAQAAAMAMPPVGAGLADALRRRFHPDLPAERLDRLAALPGTTTGAGGLRFSKPVLAVLRQGFVVRRERGEAIRGELADAALRAEDGVPLRTRPESRQGLQRPWSLNEDVGLRREEVMPPVSRRQAGTLLGLGFGFVALVGLAIFAGSRDLELGRLEQVASAPPGAAFLALAELLATNVEGEKILKHLRERENPFDVLELGLGSVEPDGLGPAVLRVVELVLPLVDEEPDDPVRVASAVWALDYAAATNSALAEEAQALRDRVLAPLRRLRPPPRVSARDPDWVDVPAGTFLMGNPEGEGGSDEWPQHEVSLPGFRMLRHEVTIGEYRRLFPSRTALEPNDLPVASVNWYKAYTYAAWLDGRLPTEAEWEYAARAGCDFAYCRQDGSETTVDEVAWTRQNSRDPKTGSFSAKPVMQREPNPWGLYDMLGNLWEWTADGHATYPDTARRAPWVAASGGWRVFRGGGFWVDAARARVTFRDWVPPDFGYGLLGFRVVLPGGRPSGRPEL